MAVDHQDPSCGVGFLEAAAVPAAAEMAAAEMFEPMPRIVRPRPAQASPHGRG